MRWMRAVAVVGLVVSTWLPVASAETVAASPSYGEVQQVAEVTLITGDTVSVGVEPNGQLTADVTDEAERRDGRPVLHSTVRDHESLYVYPSDAMGLIAAGRLDRRLFDVEYLVRNGFADSTTPTLPLIVQHGNTRAALPAAAETLALPSVDGSAVTVDKSRAAEFWAGVETARAGGTTVWLDGPVQASLDVSVPMIGAPSAWEQGYDGSGVTVAVLDTGIDAAHPDLAGKVTGTKNFVGGQTVADGNGHGTHVASTVVGSGAASAGKYKGVAPGASLLVGKVLDDEGNGSSSQIIAGMQWAVDEGADVVSMSLGGCCTDGTDPMSQAVNTLSERSGTLFVVAAGNSGARGDRTVGTPGVADAALTVAAVDKSDKLASFSSRGPRLGDFGLKPDIAGPGVDITAARAAGTQLGPLVGEHYTTLSGTSMATPHVSGAAAILAQRHPDWSGSQLKDALMSSAKDDGYGAYEQGTGRVDVHRAVDQGVRATGSVQFGKLPYAQTSPVTKAITYTNDTDAPVTLALDATISARQGTVPPGALRLDRDTVTVPAHGTATAQVTFNPTGGPDTWYQGAVRASGTGVALTTTLGVSRDLKRVTFTGKIIPPDGATDLFWGGWVLVRIDGRDEVEPIGEGPELPEVGGEIYAGRYAVRSFAQWRDRDGAPHSALIANPDVDATKNASVVFDLRKAKKIGTTLPKPAERHTQQFGFVSTSEGGAVSARTEYRAYGANTLWSLPTQKPTLGEFYAYSQRVYTQPLLTMRTGKSTLDARYPTPNAAVGDDEIARFDGRHKLPVVFAGNGTDFASIDVRGKLALLDLSDICAATCTKDGLDRVRNAQTAGAVGVLGFSAEGRGFLDPVPYGRSVWPAYPIPTVSLPPDQGKALRDSRRAVEIAGSTDPEYVYALSYPYLDRIPASLESKVGAHDVFTVDKRLHADGPGVASLSWNAQLPGINPIRRIGQGNGLDVRAPGTISVHFGPVRQGVGWNHAASLYYDAPDDVSGYARNGWSDGGIEEFPRAGKRTDDPGMAPLVSNTTRYSANVARYFTPTCLSCRNGDMFNPVHVLSANGGSGYQAYDISGGENGTDQTELHLYRNGVEIKSQQGIVWILPPFFGYLNEYFTLPPEQANYRLTERFTSDYAMQKYARTVNTEWTFTSRRPTSGFTSPEDGGNCMGWYITLGTKDVCQATSQLFVGYDLALGLDNTARAGRAHQVTISAYHSSLLERAPKIRDLDVWVSYDDGTTWKAVRTSPKGGGQFAATVVHPPLDRTAGAVTLRVRAVDEKGNTVDQTTQRAYGLR
ncbi:S8 family serine peptidase [Actinophytocola sp.]|uniref:S8 family serine peptidase n=1 Tax=Actinophytocola sp. TaxID=1872138 RepID=UPI002ED2D7C1